MTEQRHITDPHQPDDARPERAHDPGVVSPTDADPVGAQTPGSPSDRVTWLGVDDLSTPVPFEDVTGQTHAYRGDPDPPPFEAFDLDSD